MSCFGGAVLEASGAACPRLSPHAAARQARHLAHGAARARSAERAERAAALQQRPHIGARRHAACPRAGHRRVVQRLALVLVERELALGVRGGRLHRLDREPGVECHVRHQPLVRARAGLDGDDAATTADPRGAQQRKVARVGAHVDERVARRERAQQVAREGGLPHSRQQQPLRQNVCLVRAAELEAAEPDGFARPERYYRVVKGRECRKERARAEGEQRALAKSNWR